MKFVSEMKIAKKKHPRRTYINEAYSEPSQTFKTKFFAKLVSK